MDPLFVIVFYIGMLGVGTAIHLGIYEGAESDEHQ